MDNIYHALIMAGSVLLFVIGISVAIYNYSSVLEVNNRILTNSERYSRNAENAQNSDYYVTGDDLNSTDNLERIYSKAEIANMILNMYSIKKTHVESGQEIVRGKIVEYSGDGTHHFVDVPSGDVVVSSDMAYSKITVNGYTYTDSGADYNDTSRILKDDTIGKLSTFLNSTDERYVIESAIFNGRQSEVTFRVYTG